MIIGQTAAGLLLVTTFLAHIAHTIIPQQTFRDRCELRALASILFGANPQGSHWSHGGSASSVAPQWLAGPSPSVGTSRGRFANQVAQATNTQRSHWSQQKVTRSGSQRSKPWFASQSHSDANAAASQGTSRGIFASQISTDASAQTSQENLDLPGSSEADSVEVDIGTLKENVASPAVGTNSMTSREISGSDASIPSESFRKGLNNIVSNSASTAFRATASASENFREKVVSPVSKGTFLQDKFASQDTMGSHEVFRERYASLVSDSGSPHNVRQDIAIPDSKSTKARNGQAFREHTGRRGGLNGPDSMGSHELFRQGYASPVSNGAVFRGGLASSHPHETKTGIPQQRFGNADSFRGALGRSSPNQNFQDGYSNTVSKTGRTPWHTSARPNQATEPLALQDSSAMAASPEKLQRIVSHWSRAGSHADPASGRFASPLSLGSNTRKGSDNPDSHWTDSTASRGSRRQAPWFARHSPSAVNVAASRESSVSSVSNDRNEQASQYGSINTEDPQAFRERIVALQ